VLQRKARNGVREKSWTVDAFARGQQVGIMSLSVHLQRGSA
jgi:hypothetical protein